MSEVMLKFNRNAFRKTRMFIKLNCQIYIFIYLLNVYYNIY